MLDLVCQSITLAEHQRYTAYSISIDGVVAVLIIYIRRTELQVVYILRYTLQYLRLLHTERVRHPELFHKTNEFVVLLACSFHDPCKLYALSCTMICDCRRTRSNRSLSACHTRAMEWPIATFLHARPLCRDNLTVNRLARDKVVVSGKSITISSSIDD
jgi:hypothetical protein